MYSICKYFLPVSGMSSNFLTNVSWITKGFNLMAYNVLCFSFMECAFYHVFRNYLLNLML